MRENNEIKLSIDNIVSQIGFIWEAYEKFYLAWEQIKNRKNVAHFIPLWINRAFQEAIIIRLRRYLLDRGGKNKSKSLLSVLCKLNDQIKECIVLLEGKWESFSESILQKFKDELKKYNNTSFTTFCQELINTIDNLIITLNKNEKIKIKIDEVKRFLNFLFKCLQKLNLIKEKELAISHDTNEAEVFKRCHEIALAIIRIPEIEKREGEKECAYKIANVIEKFYKDIEMWLLFYKLRIIQDKFVAHSEEPEDLFENLALSFLADKKLKYRGSTLLNAVNYIITKVGDILGQTFPTNIQPVPQFDPFTVFMIPWLQPACSESQKIETIAWINRYKESKFCEIQLTNNEWFQITNFPSEYEWEPKDEVAIFQSYNFENPAAAYIICNFSKKQWVKAMRMPESWIKPQL